MNAMWTRVHVIALALAWAMVLGGGVVSDAEAQRLGRLFTTSGERSTLDDIRLQAGLPQTAPEAEPEPAPEAPAAVQVTAPEGPSISRLVINGVVRRSRGPSTVWINGDLVERGGSSREGVSVESIRGAAGSVRLRLPSGAGTVALRPGQQIDIDSGTLLEAYEKQGESAGASAFLPRQDAASKPMTEAPPSEGATPSTSDKDPQAGSMVSPEAKRSALEALPDPDSARSPEGQGRHGEHAQTRGAGPGRKSLRNPAMRSEIRFAPRRHQDGAALLIMMLLLIVGGAVLLLDGVSSAARTRTDADVRTVRALAEAKAALMAYAVTDANRPGELPCPDTDQDGVSELLVGDDCVSLRGWLPWRSLDMVGARDGSGAALWYGVSDAFHAGGSTVLNPDTVGGVVVDAGAPGDVVAVIIAPGEALGNQTRPAVAANAVTHVSAYLDGVNANINPTTYASTGAGDFNDRVAYITASELLRATEQRVLGEVAAALTGYRQANGAYPWLSPFADPFSGAATLFDGEPGTRIGHLPYNDATDVGESFATGYTITWTQGDAVVVATDLQASGPFSVDLAGLTQMQVARVGSRCGWEHGFSHTAYSPYGKYPCILRLAGRGNRR